MSAIKVTIHSTGTGPCALSGKEGDGLTISFDDGTVANQFLSWRAFRQLLGMKAMQQVGKPETKPEAKAVPNAPLPSAQPVGNGPK